MTTPFWKLHGLGNDFIFFDAMKPGTPGNFDRELTTAEVAALCDRHTGIGADGVIVVKPSPRLECAGHMHYINSDGTLAQMCGNGVRCFAKFLVDHGYVSPEEGSREGSFVADTLAGPKPITFRVDDEGHLLDATVDMGAPILIPAEIPTTLEANRTSDQYGAFVGEAPLASPWGEFTFTCVSMGNPHAVCFLDDASFAALPDECFTGLANEQGRNLVTFDVARVGAFFEAHPAFPEKTNVEFAVIESPINISMRVFERGCGETLACGTGTCATAVAANLLSRANPEVDVRLLGGTLHIALIDEHVIMTGPASQAFTGQVEL